jgi:predicted signal transduction protein with EAL and GGDEF domain
MDFKVLLRRADAALYCAKDNNRHCFQVFSAGLEESPRENEQRRNGTKALAPKA